MNRTEQNGRGVEQINNRRWMERKLRSVRFVEWDRFTICDWNGEQSVSVYGWIDREDAYKDFVLVIFWPESESHYHTTSSAERTEDLYRALVGDDLDEHNECHRVEHTFNVSNAIEVQES